MAAPLRTLRNREFPCGALVFSPQTNLGPRSYQKVTGSPGGVMGSAPTPTPRVAASDLPARERYSACCWIRRVEVRGRCLAWDLVQVARHGLAITEAIDIGAEAVDDLTLQLRRHLVFGDPVLLLRVEIGLHWSFGRAEIADVETRIDVAQGGDRILDQILVAELDQAPFRE